MTDEEGDGRRCPKCLSPRTIAHGEIASLAIAHIDCDAFYAAIEKRDRPELKDRPVIIGGGKRGVVSTACYIARTYGVHSAQPMFKALKACPDAVVIRPQMAKYVSVSREIRARMLALTPLVETLSLDEAFLDLTGTERLHQASPAETLVRFQSAIETELGLTVSIGLSYNKFLAKVGSELDKPRGFSVIGRADTGAVLEDKPVTIIFGVGKRMAATLARDGIRFIRDIKARSRKDLIRAYGETGDRLYRLARGEDSRAVDPNADRKGLSSETTLAADLANPADLRKVLWDQCERVSARAKASRIAGRGVVLKLKTADFRLRTRSRRLPGPTQLADTLFRVAAPLLDAEADGTAFRLVGLGLTDLTDPVTADLPDLADPDLKERRAAEEAIDKLRHKFGARAVIKGRSL